MISTCTNVSEFVPAREHKVLCVYTSVQQYHNKQTNKHLKMLQEAPESIRHLKLRRPVQSPDYEQRTTNIHIHTHTYYMCMVHQHYKNKCLYSTYTVGRVHFIGYVNVECLWFYQLLLHLNAPVCSNVIM